MLRDFSIATGDQTRVEGLRGREPPKIFLEVDMVLTPAVFWAAPLRNLVSNLVSGNFYRPNAKAMVSIPISPRSYILVLYNHDSAMAKFRAVS